MNHNQKVINAYQSGKVVRYHANPMFSRLQQTNADHQWGCAVLVLMLHPNPSISLICKCLLHDAGEKWTGDIPYPIKLEEPDLCADFAAVEEKFSMMKGVPVFELTEEEALWLKMVDRLECVMLSDTYLNCGNLLNDDSLDAIRNMAEHLGVGQKIGDLLDTVT